MLPKIISHWILYISLKKHIQNLLSVFGLLIACGMFIYQMMYQNGKISFRELIIYKFRKC